MAQVRVMVLRAAGTNCDRETIHAWRLAGATTDCVRIRRLIDRPNLLDACQIVTIPGGFSYGDDIAAGRIFATLIRHYLMEPLQRFVEQGGLVLGICNGFQVLVQTGLLPGARPDSPSPEQPGAPRGAGVLPEPAATRPPPRRTCTLAGNRPAGFQDRWIRLRVPQTRCVFVEPDQTFELPIAHGEGRVVLDAPPTLDDLGRAGQVAMRYVEGPPPVEPPANPNGSDGDIAGLCDTTGRVFGLMPHPERFVRAEQHPCATRRPRNARGDGLSIFERAVNASRKLL